MFTGGNGVNRGELRQFSASSAASCYTDRAWECERPLAHACSYGTCRAAHRGRFALPLSAKCGADITIDPIAPQRLCRVIHVGRPASSGEATGGPGNDAPAPSMKTPSATRVLLLCLLLASPALPALAPSFSAELVDSRGGETRPGSTARRSSSWWTEPPAPCA